MTESIDRAKFLDRLTETKQENFREIEWNRKTGMQRMGEMYLINNDRQSKIDRIMGR